MYRAANRPASRSPETPGKRRAHRLRRLRLLAWLTRLRRLAWLTWLRGLPWLTLGVIAAGGVAGALAREGLWAAFPYRPGAFNWTTLCINVAGCGLLGALMTAVTEVRHVHRLTAPFLGIGVLGGFTTFSTYIVQTQQSVAAGAPQTGLAYLAATLAAAMLATATGVIATRRLSRVHRRERS